MPELIKSVAAVASTNAFLSALLLEPTRMVPPRARSVNISMKENNVNDIDFQILGSNDNVNWKVLDTDTIVKDGWDNSVIDPNYWLYIDVQIMSTVPDTAGEVDIQAVGE